MTAQLSVLDRLRRLEDLEAIRDLFQTYRRCLDRRDLVGYSELFTEDGEWRGGSMRAEGGPPAILAMLRTHFGEGTPDADWHVVANPVVEVSGDRARASSTYLVVTRSPTGTPELRLLGQYDDELVRHPDGYWLFARREARVEMPPVGLAP